MAEKAWQNLCEEAAAFQAQDKYEDALELYNQADIQCPDNPVIEEALNRLNDIVDHIEKEKNDRRKKNKRRKKKKKKAQQEVEMMADQNPELTRGLTQILVSNKEYNDYMSQAEGQLNKMDDDLEDDRLERVVRRAKKLIPQLEDPECPLAEKERMELVGTANSYMGTALLELGRNQEAIDAHSRDFEIAKKYSLTDVHSRSLSNIALVYQANTEYSSAMKIWKSSLENTEDVSEKAWITHEMGKCHFELEEYDDARECGKKALPDSVRMRDDETQLNSLILLANSYEMLGDLKTSLKYYVDSFILAVKLGDTEIEDEMLEAIEEMDPDLAESLRIKYRGSGFRVEDEARPPTEALSARMIEVAGIEPKEEDDGSPPSSPRQEQTKKSHAMKDKYLLLLTYMLMMDD